MIITKKVIVSACNNTKYWESKGYKIERYKDASYAMRVKKGATIEVLVEDLPKGSHSMVEVRCDYCGNITEVAFKNVWRSRKIIDKDCCVECSKHKRSDSMMLLYGENNPMKIVDFKEKTKETNLKRYGVENPSQTKEVQDKIKKTNLEKYGVEHSFQSEIVKAKIKDTLNERYDIDNAMESELFKQKIIDTNQERYGVDYYIQTDEYWVKAKETNLNKYGVEYPFQSDEVKTKSKITLLERYGVEKPMDSDEIKKRIKTTCLDRYGVESYTQTQECQEKTKETNLKRYGVEWVLQSPLIREKISKTLHRNGNVKCSKQQEYLCNLFNGKLNYKISWYFADILLEDDNIVVEYDGGGHDLQVRMGCITEEEFYKKEEKRNKIFYSKGYKLIRIVSRKDKLLKDDEFLKLLDICKEYLKDENEQCIYIDIDNNKLKCRQYIFNLNEILNN